MTKVRFGSGKIGGQMANLPELVGKLATTRLKSGTHPLNFFRLALIPAKEYNYLKSR